MHNREYYIIIDSITVVKYLLFMIIKSVNVLLMTYNSAQVCAYLRSKILKQGFEW